MIRPYLLENYSSSYEAKFFVLIMLKLYNNKEGYTVKISFKECRSHLKLMKKEEIRQYIGRLMLLKNESNEPLFEKNEITDKDVKLTLTEEGILKFSMLKLFFKTEENMKGFLTMPTKICQSFWCLLQEHNFETFKISADELAKNLNVHKYRLTQGKSKNTSMLERLVKTCRKAGIYIAWSLVNECNIKEGIVFLIEKHAMNSDPMNILGQKLNQINLTPDEIKCKKGTLLEKFFDNELISLSQEQKNIIEKIKRIKISNEESRYLLFRAFEYMIK